MANSCLPTAMGNTLAPPITGLAMRGRSSDKNYGYTSRVISNGPTNGYPGQVWASSGGDQSAPNTIARAATGGAGQQGVGNGQQGVADGQKGGGPEENVRVVSRCGQLDGGGKFCETTRTSGDAQLLDNSSFNGNGNGQADNTKDGQSNTSPDLSDLADAQYEQASKNQTSAADTTDGTSST
ncbi:hypothetical protein PCANC_28022 [Puccinia coronata f. sp. avenae]|uniref:Uncharacterized protein n=1 Tax=Puccinia coronata f. sp. avenae TaxID=200324 RepID=A0A2N5RUD5_9BASI|nr:hypothetical protein PCANC_28022 [Puccinia coronata f. sp. avenae]